MLRRSMSCGSAPQFEPADHQMTHLQADHRLAALGQALLDSLPLVVGQIGRIGSAFHSYSVLERLRLFQHTLNRLLLATDKFTD